MAYMHKKAHLFPLGQFILKNEFKIWSLWIKDYVIRQHCRYFFCENIGTVCPVFSLECVQISSCGEGFINYICLYMLLIVFEG